MAKKLFVGSLSYNTTEDTLHDYFSRAGTVESAKVIFDRDTGRSRGFGFVEMATPEEANAAIEQLHETELDGRRIIVNEAREKRDGGGGGNRF